MGFGDDGTRPGSDPGEQDRGRASSSLIGLVVANRYRIERLISAGAYTIVVDAVDVQLDRLVTLKLIRPEISELPEFQRRFEQVVRSMSTLSHVNIAAAHDWGEDRIGGRTTMFAVVEYLGAGSLRDLLDRGRLLTSSQALVVGLDACRALDHAHRRNLVHGEVTPAKLVFGDDRRLRIIDFGLARLLGASAWREPATVETHVARYASPEQALGQPIDAKTDVYALALVLIESVTGSVPFAADSTVATLSARIGKLTSVSADLGSLAAVLERAARPDRGDRWTAAEFGRALVRAAEKLPRPEPLPLVTASSLFRREPTRRPTDPTGGMDRPADPAGSEPAASTGERGDDEPADADLPPIPLELVRVAPLALAPDADPDEEADGSPAPIVPPPPPVAPGLAPIVAAETPTEPAIPPVGPPEPAAPAGTATPFDAGDDLPPAAPPPVEGNHDGATASPGDDAVSSERTKGTPTRLWLRALVGFLLLAALAGVAVIAYLLLRTERHEVPALAGSTEAEAVAAVREFDWDVQTRVERSDEEPDEGEIIRTEPESGDMLAEGEPLVLVISEGPEFRELPEVRGLTAADARETLRELRLESSTTEPAFHERIPPGSVVSWIVAGEDEKQAGDTVLPGAEIELTLSQGPEPRAVPDLRTLSVTQARSRLEELGLELRVGRPVFSRIIERDLIARQRPATDSEVERGATVTVIVSKGPDLVVFPNLEGLGFRAAVRRIEESGLVRGDVLGSTQGEFQRASVDGATADPGEEFLRGSRVDLVFL